jgi:acetyl-CoA synthetase
MAARVIKKTKEDRYNANLPDYSLAYRSFLWPEVEKEVSRFSNHILNSAYVAIDRHADTETKHKIALYYESEENQKEQYTFGQLKDLSNKFANVLIKQGVNRKDRVFIFLPRIPELYVAFLGILKTVTL